MSTLSQSFPASFRRPPQTSRFAANLRPDNRRSEFAAAERLPVAINSSPKSRFARLPHEPEDARITGVTRSLHRRLLALNLGGSLADRHLNVPHTRMA